MDLGKVVGVQCFARHASYGKLALVGSVSDPVVSVVNCFEAAECDCSVGYSLGWEVVAVDGRGGRLLVSEGFEYDKGKTGCLAVGEQCCIFGFGC